MKNLTLDISQSTCGGQYKQYGEANSGIFVRVPQKKICKDSTKYSTVRTTISGVFTTKYPTIEVRFGTVFFSHSKLQYHLQKIPQQWNFPNNTIVFGKYSTVSSTIRRYREIYYKIYPSLQKFFKMTFSIFKHFSKTQEM